MKWLLCCISICSFILCVQSANSKAADLSETLPIEETLQAVDPWTDLPDDFVFSGTVVDDSGTVQPDVAILVAGQLVTHTDDSGNFSIESRVKPTTSITFEHPMLADQTQVAGFWFAGEDQPVTVQLKHLDVTFTITPAGGTYKSGGISLDVPSGAVNKSTTVHASRLPLELGYEQSPDIQIQRLAVVEFSPEGLIFNKPVKVSIDLDYPATDSIAELLLLDRKEQRFINEPASVTIVGGKASFYLDHFSRRTVGDPGKGIVKKHLERTNDINGDGKLTSEDADFVILLSGGTQSADFTITTSDSTTVSKTTSKSSSTGSSSSASVGGGVEIAGSGLDVSHTVSKEKSSEVTKKSGLDKTTASSSSTTSRLQANEYELQCKYYTGIYDYYLIEEWQLHKPNDWEQKALEEAYANRKNKSASWSYFTWDRSTSIGLNKTMYGKTRLAIRSGDKGIQVYRMTGSYIVKKRFATYPVNCKPGNMQKRIDKATEGASNSGQAASQMKDRFSFFGGEDKDSGYKGWGLLSESDVQFKIGQECGNESEGDYEFSSAIGSEEGKETSTSESASAETEATASGGAEIGPVKLSVEVSASSGSSAGKSEAESYARNVMSSASTKVHWHIINAHNHHYSDHMVAPLHNVKEVNGQTIKRPIGLMIVRYREYPCTTYTTTGTPSSTPPPPPAPETKPTQAGRTVTPSGPTRPAEPTAPPPSSSSQDDKVEPTTPSNKTEPAEKTSAEQNIPEHINVRFSDLTGTLLINRSMVGQPRGIEIVGVAPESIQDGDISASSNSETIQVTINRDIPDSAIFLQGNVRSMLITATEEPEVKGEEDSSGIVPLTGAIVAVAGFLEATFDLPDNLVDKEQGPEKYQVELGDTSLTPVAIKGNEIAVAGTGITAPENGSQIVTVTSPSGETVSSPVNIWSYEVTPQPVAHINKWAPINMQCSGYAGDVVVRFIPGPGQTVEPLEQNVACGSLAAPRSIARYMTTVLGDQPLNVTVEKMR